MEKLDKFMSCKEMESQYPNKNFFLRYDDIEQSENNEQMYSNAFVLVVFDDSELIQAYDYVNSLNCSFVRYRANGGWERPY